jgi:hypothetical protein
LAHRICVTVQRSAQQGRYAYMAGERKNPDMMFVEVSFGRTSSAT